MSSLFSLIPYTLALGTIGLGLVEFFRKREEYKSEVLMRSVFAALILMGVLTLVSLYRESAEKEETKHKAEQDIQDLKGKVEIATKAEQTAIDNQRDNTAAFLKQFQKLSGELGDLKTQVKTDALQKKFESVQTELENTQKALAPGPKATLPFTFVPFINPPFPQHAIPVTNVTLPVNEDGSVHVDFSVLNNTDVDALDGEVILQICDGCRFAKEPANFSKVKGQLETQRDMRFDRVFRASVLSPLSVDVIIPSNLQLFAVGMQYRCRTCVPNSELFASLCHKRITMAASARGWPVRYEPMSARSAVECGGRIIADTFAPLSTSLRLTIAD
jgi:hypothetical protein